MAGKSEIKKESNVDKGLVAMFLKMSPEERLLTNDNAARTIMELRNVFRQQQADKRESQTKQLPVLEKTLRQLEKE
jgi:hypothetical protein